MNIEELTPDVPRKVVDGRVWEPMTIQELNDVLCNFRRMIVREFEGDLWKDVGPANGPWSVL